MTGTLAQHYREQTPQQQYLRSLGLQLSTGRAEIIATYHICLKKLITDMLNQQVPEFWVIRQTRCRRL